MTLNNKAKKIVLLILSVFLLLVVMETLPRSISLLSNYFQYLSQKKIVDNISNTDTRLIEVQTKKGLLKEAINKMVTSVLPLTDVYN